METVGDRVKKARLARKMPRTTLAKKIGAKGYSYVSELELGRMQRGSLLHRIAETLGVNLFWLETGKGAMDAPASTHVETVNLVATNHGLSAGAGADCDQPIETRIIPFPLHKLASKGLKAKNLHIEDIRGTSGEPYVKDGGSVLVDISDTKIKNGKLYWIRHEGHYHVKQLFKSRKNVVIESLNKDDPQWRIPIVVAEGDDFDIVGRVRGILNWED